VRREGQEEEEGEEARPSRPIAATYSTRSHLLDRTSSIAPPRSHLLDRTSSIAPPRSHPRANQRDPLALFRTLSKTTLTSRSMDAAVLVNLPSTIPRCIHRPSLYLHSQLHACNFNNFIT
jgi:hypothetical protein